MKTGVEDDIKRMQGMYGGMGFKTGDASSGGSIEGDIANLQKRNTAIKKTFKPVYEGVKAGGLKAYTDKAIEFARNLLGRKKKVVMK